MKSWSCLFVILSAVLSVILAGCGATVTPPPPVTLRLAGSTSMQPLLADLSAAYSARAPHVTILVEGGGSRLGREWAQEGKVDLGLSSWLPAEADVGWSVPIALDEAAQNGRLRRGDLVVLVAFGGGLTWSSALLRW